MGKPRPFLPILCTGVFSSGSTWLFNVVVALCQASAATDGRTVGQFYADSVERHFPAVADLPEILVIKSHMPDKALQMLARMHQAPVLMTLREPRDALASLVARFDVSFASHADVVARNAKSMVRLAELCQPLILRYEERFYDDRQTIIRIAAFLKLSVSQQEIDRIFDFLRRESVTAQIDAMQLDGTFTPGKNKAAIFEPKTHWHPNHVGDLEIGKYNRILSAEQQFEIVERTKAYCKYFRYPASTGFHFSTNKRAVKYKLGDLVQFKHGRNARYWLHDGWSRIGPNFVWALGTKSIVVLPIDEMEAEHAPLCLRMEVRPFIYGDGGQRLTILVNAESLFDECLFGPATLVIDLPRERLQPQPLVITLLHSDAARPRDHVLGSTDERLLSFGLKWLQIGLRGVPPRIEA